MILDKDAIRRYINLGLINITPFKEENLNPNSYNLTIEDKIYVYERATLDMKSENDIKEIKITDEGYRLKPGVVYLVPTLEKAGSLEFAPMITGRSSVGRLGVNVVANAGFGDIGFYGNWTLQITVAQPTIIYSNMQLAQIYFLQVNGNKEGLYESDKYINSDGVQKSKLYMDFVK